MKKNLLGALFVIIALTGCTSGPLPANHDPYKKLDYSWQLINQGRPTSAAYYAKEALNEFEKKNDLIGIAKANHFFGVLYISPSYRADKAFYIEEGTYDSTGKKAMQHLLKAKEAWLKVKDIWGVSVVQLAMGDVHAVHGNLDGACSQYKTALKTYQREDNVFTGRVHTFNTTYGDYMGLLKALISRTCKSESNA